MEKTYLSRLVRSAPTQEAGLVQVLGEVQDEEMEKEEDEEGEEGEEEEDVACWSLGQSGAQRPQWPPPPTCTPEESVRVLQIVTAGQCRAVQFRAVQCRAEQFRAVQ